MKESRKLDMIKNIIEGNPVAYKITGNSLGIHGNESGAIFEECAYEEEIGIDQKKDEEVEE